MCRLFGLAAGAQRVAATFWLLEAPDSLAEQSRRPVTFLAILDLPGTPLRTHEETIERLKPLLRR